jgi:Peptidase family M23
MVARLRMPVLAAAAVGFAAAALGGAPAVVVYVLLALLVVALAYYFRLGTPNGPIVDLTTPVRGPWEAVYSPTTRVPSHGVHAWGQTFAVDLVFDPGDGSRPGFRWRPVTRPPQDFPGFGQPVRSPLAGEVVRSRDVWRDHRSRTSPLGLLWLVVESARELLGPGGVFGNHVVVRGGDGTCVVLAHLRRGSVRVGRGDRVEPGQVVAECGNSGNSSEPHLHIQAMDRPSAWVGASLRFTFDGRPVPPTGGPLDSSAGVCV